MRNAFFLLSIFAVIASRAASLAPIPDTPKKARVEEYHGVKVSDDYAWLENWEDPAVKQWSREQNSRARSFLDEIPARAQLHARLKELYSGMSKDYGAIIYRRGRLFAMKTDPPKEQPLLVTMKAADNPASERVILDLNRLDAKGTTAIDFYEPSVDGKLVAVSLSEKGSESGTLHIYDASSGKELRDTIPRVNGPTAGGSVAWNHDGSGFYYTRYPRGSERPAEDMDFYQQVYFHRLGTDTAQDRYAIGKEFPRIAEIKLDSSDDGRDLIATVANGDGGDFAHYLLGRNGQWIQLTRFEDKIAHVVFGKNEDLYLISRQEALRGKVLRLSLKRPGLKQAEIIIPESEGVIQAVVPTNHRLYIVDLIGGPSQIRSFDSRGRDERRIMTKNISTVGGMISAGGDEILFRNESYLETGAWYRFGPRLKEPRKTKLASVAPAEFGDIEVVREIAISKDGTRVPLNIMHKKGITLDGSNPTLLYGYGGYGVSMSPGFRVGRRVWFDHGGGYVVANIRGGGEFGEAWHLSGNLTHKQNVFDDFLACAQYLIDHRYTNPKRLAIQGGSNGGLLMGAALTQRPDLFRAVVAQVGVLDMLRVELDPNGVFNITEFGTVKDPEQFKALYAYSPYHRVKDQTQYPAVLFMTGENDGRVNPLNSRKMTARLQAASSGDRPVLLRTSSSTGHGAGTALSERVNQDADIYAFLMNELEMK